MFDVYNDDNVLITVHFSTILYLYRTIETYKNPELDLFLVCMDKKATLMTRFLQQLRFLLWRLRSLLLDSCIDFVNNSFFNSFMIPSISITLDEGSDMFFRRHKEVVRSARALSHELRPRFLDDERIYNTMFSTSRLLAPSSG